MTIPVVLNIMKRKGSKYFYIECPELSISEKSDVSFEDCENKIVNRIEILIWNGNFNIGVKFNEAKIKYSANGNH